MGLVGQPGRREKAGDINNAEIKGRKLAQRNKSPLPDRLSVGVRAVSVGREGGV